MKPQRITKEDALEKMQIFNDDKLSLFMATVSEDGEPFVSYTPYVEDEDFNIYVVISNTVPHSFNLEANGKASVMTIEDEAKCSHIYARERFYASVKSEKIEKDDERKAKIMDIFAKRFGEDVRMFDKMPGFSMFKLIPQDSNLVLGFGSAYSISTDRKSIELKNIGHKAKHK